MSFGDRFGMAGVILALFALASQYLWPDKKWIGWLSLSCAVALLVSWGWLEFGSELPRLRSRYSVISAVVVFIVGGCLALVAWRLVTPPLSLNQASILLREKERTKEEAQAQNQQTRQDLYVKLSRQQAERVGLYTTEFMTELKFLAAEAESHNKHHTDARRQERAEEANKQLSELEAYQRGPLAKYQQELAETIAHIRLAFPKDAELDRLLDSAVVRPVWDMNTPNCGDTRDMACMQRWATTEADKGTKATEDSSQRIAAVLGYMQGHMGP